MFSHSNDDDEENAALHRQANEAKILRNKIRMFTMMVYKYFCTATFTEELDEDIQQQLGQVYESVQDFMNTIDIRQSGNVLYETAMDDSTPTELINSMKSRLDSLAKGEKTTSFMSPILQALGSLLQAAENYRF
ncbi:unnamed protein product [Diamesa hyperborea]